MSASEKIERAGAKMLLGYPWWASLYLQAIRVETARVPTMGVDGTYLYYNPEFTEQLTDAEVLAVLLHETAHLALLHCYRRKWRDPFIWNLAADQAVNTLLNADGIRLPDGCVPAGDPNLTAEEIYDQLIASAITVKVSGGRGAGGSGKNAQQVSQDVYAPGELNPGSADKDVSGQQQIQQKQMSEKDWQDAISSAHGTAPEMISRIVRAATAPVIDWKAELAEFMHATVRAGDHTWTRLSRRVPNAPGWKRDPETNVAVCVDTSGSVDDTLLGEFLSEIQSITALTGIRAHLISCDAVVHQVIEPGEQIPALVGGGGTDFRPALTRAESLLVDACVYLTDGQGEFPAGCSLPVLWVLTQRATVPFGKSIPLRRAG